MTGQTISTETAGLDAQVLDHSRDFVELVSTKAPGEYRRLLNSMQFQNILRQTNNFNHGKLFAYAEFLVFSREFRDRFPDASAEASINAFSRLFLKNDISISNLVRFMQGSDEFTRLRLNTPDGPGD